MYINILLERHPYSTTWKKVQGIGQVPGRYNQQDMSEIGTNLDKREKKKIDKGQFRTRRQNGIALARKTFYDAPGMYRQGL